MKILGHTLSGEVIIVISEEELKDLQKGEQVTITDPWETEAYKVLKTAKLPGLNWLGWFRSLFDSGEFDGSVMQLIAVIEAGRPVLYTHGYYTRLSKKSIQKLLGILKDYKDKPAPPQAEAGEW